MGNSFFYLQLGFKHILPFGFDHILFILCLFFSDSHLKSLLWQATAFTIAHSITLALAMCSSVSFPSFVVEPVIAFSIVVFSMGNIFSNKLPASRIILVFIFGLVHGMGFAGALKSLGLPEDQFFSSLLSFNIGVELAQITIIFLAWFLLAKLFREKPWYRKRIVIPISAIIAVIAFYWTAERIFFA
ncbi:MAG TPA: HupE/UreJ family protein [Bacteroidia bacterium]|jgi:hypothetical protein